MQLLPRILRCGLTSLGCVLLSGACATAAPASDAPAAQPTTEPAARRLSIVDAGAAGDGATLNTPKIQSAIDRLASEGGGTLVVPKGVFLRGAIFLKPGVNLQLDEGAVLKGSTDTKDYPKTRTRIEGHFEEWLPALVNADRADHLRITGPGTLDGSGEVFYRTFWDARKRDSKVTNVAV